MRASDQGLPQPVDQSDPEPSRPDDHNDPAPSHLEDQNDPAPYNPDDQNYPGPPQAANMGAVTGSTATTTTLGPLEEYCKEACAEGIGGSICDYLIKPMIKRS